MKPSLLALASLAVGTFGSLPTVAKAEIVHGESIDWVVADSERVFLGKVVKVEDVRGHEVVTVAVSKTFRGKREAEVTFVVPVRGGRAAEGWLKLGVPMVFGLVPRERVKNNTLPQDYDWVIRPGIMEHSAVFLGRDESHGTVAVITRDFDVLKEPDAIVKHIEAYAKTIPPDWKKKALILHVPSETPAFMHLWRRSNVLLTVPADAQMEALGRAWCQDKDVETRARGAQVLGEFKNEANIRILKALLRDPGSDIVSGSQSFPKHILRTEDRVFPVRAAAYAALRGFGVEVERPVTTVPLKRTKEPIPKR
jgi:hypothetical protein